MNETVDRLPRRAGRGRRWAVCCAVVAALAAPVIAAGGTVTDGIQSRTEAIDRTIRDQQQSADIARSSAALEQAGLPTQFDIETPQRSPMTIAEAIAEMQSTNAAELISLNYKDGDLRNILRLIARVSGINLVAGPDVQGKVTIELKDVQWEHALALVLGANGYTYVREGNIVRVVSSALAEREPLAVGIIPVNYAKAEELLPVLRPLLTPERGKVESDQRANVLVITDIPEKLSKIEKVVQRLDQPTPQVLIEAKFVEITIGNSDKQGVDWTEFDDYGILMHDMLYDFDREITKTMGRDHAEGSGVTWPNHADNQGVYNRVDKLNTAYQITPEQFRLSFSALLNNERAKLISNPRLQTLDNRKAVIRVAETMYKPTFTYNKETGAYEINSLEELDIGIVLEVTPHVNYNGYVTLDIAPEVSSLSGNQTIQGVEVPIRNIRRIDTRVSLKDSYTVVVGGLIRDEWVDTRHSVPFLGDTPYVGENFFSWNSKEKKAVSLVIFITPTVIKTDAVNPRWDTQLRDMQLTHAGDFQDVVSNYPSWHMVTIREKLLLQGATNVPERIEPAR